jgi:putative MFS transporter
MAVQATENSMPAQARATDPYFIAARLERLPVSAWHTKMRFIIGSALFFDAYDVLTIAFVLPVLIPAWHLVPAQIGALISVGFAGQILGSIFFGWLSERVGRIPVIITTILIFAFFSFACAGAWDFQSMLILRFLQGMGLGGETPVSQAYINEFAKAAKRGRFSMLTQPFFAGGICAGALLGAWVVPNFGWQWMFIIGGLPALITLPMRYLMPESPRWLVSRGRFDDADRSMKKIEAMVSENGAKPLPPIPANLPQAIQAPPRFAALFKGIYRRRTLSIWSLWFTDYFISYAVTGWLPSILTGTYKIPLAEALRYNFALTLVGLIASIICFGIVDRTGRKRVFVTAMSATAIGFFVLWFLSPLTVVMLMAVICVAWIGNAVVASGLPMYTAENYPNNLRALGGGCGGAWLRIAATISPFAIGYILPVAGIGAVFGMMGVVATIGAVICLKFSDETAGKTLEEISPSTV